MGWLATLKLHRMAKQYVRRLPSQLRKGWGGSKHYPPGQIRAAIKTAGLDPDYSFLGYAMFLPQAEYVALAGEPPPPLDFEATRKLLARFAPASSRTSMGDGVGFNFSEYVGSSESGGVGLLGGGHHGQ